MYQVHPSSFFFLFEKIAGVLEIMISGIIYYSYQVVSCPNVYSHSDCSIMIMQGPQKLFAAIVKGNKACNSYKY